MKANLKQLEEIQKELFKQQCDLDIQKAMVNHFIKKKKAEQLTLTDVVSTYHCESYDFKRQGRRCAKQCDSCEWMEKKQ